MVGYGIVVGLAGSGDGGNGLTKQSLQSMVSQFGLVTDVANITASNAAAVMVTAEMPAFVKTGQRLDVTISAIGGAKSLRGGTLLMTPLLGADGETYAVAQGPLTLTGVSVDQAGSSIQIGVPTSGRIPNGATVERMIATPFDTSEHIVLNIREADFSTSTAITEAINVAFGDGTAKALDGVSIAVQAPTESSQRVAFLSMVENLDVSPGEPPARVVINSPSLENNWPSTVRTGVEPL